MASKSNIVVLAFAGVVLFFLLVVEDLRIVSGAIALLGAACFWLGVRTPPERFRHRMRHIRGSGWWLGRLIAALPYRVGQAVWLALSVGIIVVGVWGLTSA